MKQPTKLQRSAISGTVSGSGMIRLDSRLGVLSLDERAGSLLGNAPEAVLGKKIDEVVDLGNLANLMKSGIGFSNQVIVAGATRLACDYLPLPEEGGGVLTLLSLLPARPTGGGDDLKELLRSAGDFMNLDYDGIVVVDHEAHVVMVNNAFAEFLGTAPHAMIGKHVFDAYPPNSQPSHLPAVLKSGKPEIGITHYLNGKQVYASLYPLIRDGKVIGGLGKILFKDVRELTQIANRLSGGAQSRSNARSASGSSPVRYDLASIIGESQKIAALKESVLRVAQKNSNVLVRGESGTGKELFAHAIHAASSRRFSPFVKVNCAAIPEHLLESELFGYAEGAFTGAKKGGQIGKFEQAHGGTIFLDEIGDMPLYMQAKMLRVLQERELTPLGSTAPKAVDVRVVAATNCDLEQLVLDGKFREDLYYRLKVVTLTVPPLRARMEDLQPLVSHFIGEFNAEFGVEVQGLDPEAWDIFSRYHWPGNIRELRNVIESAFNAVSGPLILREHLPDQLSQLVPSQREQAVSPAQQEIANFIRASLGNKDLGRIMDGLEKLVVEAAVEFTQGNKLKAAELLGISRQWLYKKLQKHKG